MSKFYRRKAKSTLTPIELDYGEILEFTLHNNKIQRLTLLETSSKAEYGKLPFLYSQKTKKNIGQGVYRYTFSCKININGKEIELKRIVPSQESFYEPWEIDGMRLWFDAVSDIFIDDGGFLTEKDDANLKIFCRPRKKARFIVNDIKDQICPQTLADWYINDSGRIDVKDCYCGEDVWMGPYYGKKAHGGLDINMKAGTKLYAPIDFDDQFYIHSLETGHNNNRWRGIRYWGNGSVWCLQSHHLVDLLVEQHTPIKQGQAYATTAGVMVGVYEHTHFVFKVFDQGDEYFLDPWIIFWQILKNKNLTTIKPEE